MTRRAGPPGSLIAIAQRHVMETTGMLDCRTPDRLWRAVRQLELDVAPVVFCGQPVIMVTPVHTLYSAFIAAKDAAGERMTSEAKKRETEVDPVEVDAYACIEGLAAAFKQAGFIAPKWRGQVTPVLCDECGYNLPIANEEFPEQPGVFIEGASENTAGYVPEDVALAVLPKQKETTDEAN